MPDFIRVNLVSFILLGVAIVACVAAIIVSIVQKKNAKPTIDIIMPEKEEKKENDKKTAMIMPRAKSTETKPLEPKPVETKVEEPKTETVSADEEQEEEVEETNIIPESKQEETDADEYEEETDAEQEKEEEDMAEKPQTKQYSGKWFVYQKAEKEFIAVLKASNGQIVLTSESYASAKSVEDGIETIKKNVALDHFTIYTDKKDNYFYKLKDSGNKLLCIGEVYSTKSSCESSITSVKKFAENAILQPGVVEDMTIEEYVPTTDKIDDATTSKGKWVITKEDDGFMATLYASNGQKLLTSEIYKQLSGVNSAIENYKKNCEDNNFVIDRTKNGTYYYKLRNAQKLTLAVGETYDTKRACISALESFKRFAQIAKIVPYGSNE